MRKEKKEGNESSQLRWARSKRAEKPISCVRSNMGLGANQLLVSSFADKALGSGLPDHDRILPVAADSAALPKHKASADCATLNYCRPAFSPEEAQLRHLEGSSRCGTSNLSSTSSQ